MVLDSTGVPARACRLALASRQVKVGNLLPAMVYAGLIAWELQHLSLTGLPH